MLLPWNLLFTGERHLSNAICVCGCVGPARSIRDVRSAPGDAARAALLWQVQAPRGFSALRGTRKIPACLSHQQVALPEFSQQNMQKWQACHFLLCVGLHSIYSNLFKRHWLFCCRIKMLWVFKWSYVIIKMMLSQRAPSVWKKTKDILTAQLGLYFLDIKGIVFMFSIWVKWQL